MAELFCRRTTGYEVQAVQVGQTEASAIAHWCGGVAVVEHDALNAEDTRDGVNVPTMNGMMRASAPMWIVRDTDGRFEIYGPIAFERIFAPVQEVPFDGESPEA